MMFWQAQMAMIRLMVGLVMISFSASWVQISLSQAKERIFLMVVMVLIPLITLF